MTRAGNGRAPDRLPRQGRVPGRSVTEADLRAFARDQLGSVKAPKQVEVWPNLPRSKVGKILKGEVKARLLGSPPP